MLSRCLKFNLKRLPADEIGACLEQVLTEEAIGFDASAVKLLARAAEGSMRDALSLLDQAIAYGAGTVAEEEVRAMLGAVDRSRVVELLDAIAIHDAPGALEVVGAIAGDAADYADVLGELVNTLHRIAVRQAVPEAADPDPDLADAHARLAGRLSLEDVQLYYEIGIRGRRDLALAPDPRLGLEMAVLRMLAFSLDAGAAASLSAVPVASATRAAPVTAQEQATEPAASAPVAVSSADDAPDPASMTPRTWRDVVEGLGLSGLVGELASNTSLVEAGERRLKLELDPAHAQLDAPSARRGLQDAIAARFGRPIELVIGSGAPGHETPAAERERAEARRRRAAVRAIEEDPGARTLCETFGTRIDPALVWPVA